MTIQLESICIPDVSSLSRWTRRSLREDDNTGAQGTSVENVFSVHLGLLAGADCMGVAKSCNRT